MTKFGSNAGVADDAYIDVMESVCTMIDHAKSFELQSRASNQVLSSRGAPAMLQGITEGQDTVITSPLGTGNADNIYNSMTALATWSMGEAQPSQHFRSFGPISIPIKRKRTASFPLSSVSITELSNEQNVLHSSEPSKPHDSLGPHRPVISRAQSQIGDTKISQSHESFNQQRLISQWLSPLDHQETHNFNLSQRYQETGIWLSTMPKFKQWRDSSQSSSFWLYGAGSLPLCNYCMM